MDNIDPNAPGRREEPKNVPLNNTSPRPSASPPPLKLSNEAPPNMPKIAAPTTSQKPTEKAVSTQRITGSKLFFTKLHPGSLNFLNEQINEWLKANPGVVLRGTNMVTGEVADKKTEPNLIIMVWY